MRLSSGVRQSSILLDREHFYGMVRGLGRELSTVSFAVGYAELKAGRPSLAIAPLERALTLRPGDPRSQRDLAASRAGLSSGLGDASSTYH